MLLINRTPLGWATVIARPYYKCRTLTDVHILNSSCTYLTASSQHSVSSLPFTISSPRSFQSNKPMEDKKNQKVAGYLCWTGVLVPSKIETWKVTPIAWYELVADDDAGLFCIASSAINIREWDVSRWGGRLTRSGERGSSCWRSLRDGHRECFGLAVTEWALCASLVFRLSK